MVSYLAEKFSLYILRQGARGGQWAVGKWWDGPTAEKIDEKKFREKKSEWIILGNSQHRTTALAIFSCHQLSRVSRHRAIIIISAKREIF